MRLLYILLFLFISNTVFGYTEDDFNYYKKLNDSENKLAEYKDNDADLRLKLIQLDEINASRKQYKVQEVALDILASRVANKMAKEAAEKGFTGHWNTAGEKPYHRYAFAGGVDHVAENAFGEWSSQEYKLDQNSIAQKMYKGHKLFMAEKAPNDGHKKNCTDPTHNFVGIGFYVTGHYFRYYEEFIDRYYTFDYYPTEPVKKKEEVRMQISIPKGAKITYNFVSYERRLKKKLPFFLKFKGSYLDGSDKMEVVSVRGPFAHKTDPTKETIYVDFTPKKKGMYYLHLSHKQPNSSGKLKGEDIFASGIIIFVE